MLCNILVSIFISFNIDYLTNAFNRMDRAHIFEQLYEMAPSLLPVAVAQSGGETTTSFTCPISRSVYSIPVCQGTTQGSPISAALFSLALKKPLDVVREVHPKVGLVGYLDDLYLYGELDDILSAFNNLLSVLPKGTVVNLDKTSLHPCSLKQSLIDACGIKAVEFGIKHHQGGIIACGAPIGEDDFINEIIESKVT